MTEDTANAHAANPTPAQGRWFVLFLLIIVYTLNFLDRQILSILAVPIKAEFGLTDSQLGMLSGAFGLTFAVLALPAAWLADRYSRTWIMTGALTLWSGFTALCGLAANFPQLCIARMGVGIGEAGGVAPAYSLITGYFPPRLRARALAIFSFGIPLGSASGILFGGLLAAKVDWRFAFVALGALGVLFAPIFRLLVREPPRAATTQTAPGLLATAAIAVRKPAFWLLSFGASFASLVGYGLMFWLPSFAVRSLGFDMTGTAQFLASVTFFGGLAGMFAGGWLADALGQSRRAAYPVIPALALLISAPLYVLAVTSPPSAYSFWLFVIPQAFGLVWLGPVLTAVQHVGPANTRSQMSALCLLINSLIGLGIGPWFFGHMSDIFRPEHGADSMKYAFLTGLGFYGVAAVCLLLAATRMKKDWVED